VALLFLLSSLKQPRCWSLPLSWVKRMTFGICHTKIGGFLVVSKSRRTPQGAVESIDSKVGFGAIDLIADGTVVTIDVASHLFDTWEVSCL
jgi:hypothetical protein